jgi:tetratricopeptide (TPR) repeat protein
VLAGSQGDHVDERRLLEECLTLRRGLGDPVEVAGTLSTLALARLHAGDPAAAAQAEREALQIFGEVGNRVGEAIGHEHLGHIALYRGNLDEARAELERALAIGREIEHREIEESSQLLLGQTAFAARDFAQARERFEAALAIARDGGDRDGEAKARRWLGKLDLEGGALAPARQRLGDALRAFDEFEVRDELVACLEDHAELLLREGRPEHAAQLAGAAAQARLRLALMRPPHEDRLWDGFVARLREALENDAFDDAWQRGQSCETKQAINGALNPPERAASCA